MKGNKYIYISIYRLQEIFGNKINLAVFFDFSLEIKAAFIKEKNISSSLIAFQELLDFTNKQCTLLNLNNKEAKEYSEYPTKLLIYSELVRCANDLNIYSLYRLHEDLNKEFDINILDIEILWLIKSLIFCINCSSMIDELLIKFVNTEAYQFVIRNISMNIDYVRILVKIIMDLRGLSDEQKYLSSNSIWFSILKHKIIKSIIRGIQHVDFFTNEMKIIFIVNDIYIYIYSKCNF